MAVPGVARDCVVDNPMMGAASAIAFVRNTAIVARTMDRCAQWRVVMAIVGVNPSMATATVTPCAQATMIVVMIIPLFVANNRSGVFD